MGKSFLIVVDANSKWAEVVEMISTTTANTIVSLRNLFATHGLPRQIVSDNGPQFVSSDFQEFTRTNEIKYSRSSSYHPATNGEAERFVRTFKEAMKISKEGGLTVTHRLQNFLLTHRTTPHGTTGTPPCELLMSRALRTRWDLFKPSIENKVITSQDSQKKYHDGSFVMRSFYVGQKVMARNFRQGAEWIPGEIVRQLGPITCLVDVAEGRSWKRHTDHIKDLMVRPQENETVPPPTADSEMPEPTASEVVSVSEAPVPTPSQEQTIYLSLKKYDQLHQF